MAVVDSAILRRGPARGAPRVMPLILLGLTAVFVGVSAGNEQWGPLVVVLGAIGAIGIGAFVLLRPEAALRISFFLILVATTKFRARGAFALLSGNIDAQVIFELLCYAAASLAVAVNLLPAIRRQHTLHLTRIELLLGGYVLLAMASALWSDYVQVTVGRAMQLAILYVLCAVAVRRLGPGPTLRTLAASLVIYVLLAAGIAAVFPWARPDGQLFSWFAVHPGDAGGLAGLAAMIMIGGAIYAPHAWRRSLKRLALWAAVIACAVVVIAAHERTPILAFLTGTSTLWLRKHLRPWATGLALCVMLLLSGISLRTLASSYAGASAAPDFENAVVVYVMRGQSGEEFLGLSGRVELWDYVYSLIRERPLIGHGYLASRSLMLESFSWAGESHGALPEVTLNLGLLGALLLGAIVLRTLISAFARTGVRGAADAWGQAAVLGGFVFLMVLAVASDSFAGAPGYEILLFFAATMAHENLGREDLTPP